MLRSSWTWFGLLLILAGVVWVLQGLGFVDGSFMSGDTSWAVIGAIVAAAGLGSLVMAARRSRQ